MFILGKGGGGGLSCAFFLIHTSQSVMLRVIHLRSINYLEVSYTKELYMLMAIFFFQKYLILKGSDLAREC